MCSFYYIDCFPFIVYACTSLYLLAASRLPF